MSKITITRALANLKLLDKKINDAIQKSVFATYMVNKVQKEKEFKPKENLQGIEDLIKERAKIKSAIMASNTVTEISFNDLKMKVIDAIEYKNTIVYEKTLLNKMITDYRRNNSSIESINTDVQQKVDVLLNTTFGREAKPSADMIDAISKPYEERNSAKDVEAQGFKLLEKIEKLSSKIETFESEIDLLLSESNASTTIEI